MRGRTGGGGGGGTAPILRFAAAILIYCCGFFMGWQGGLRSQKPAVVSGRSVSGIANENIPQIALKSEPKNELKSNDADVERAYEQKMEATTEDSSQTDESAKSDDGSLYLVTARGKAITVQHHGISVEIGTSGDQERYLSGEQLTQEEIEDLPMYKDIFSNDLLRESNRKVLICPPWDSGTDILQIPLKHLPRKKPTSVDQKYDRRASNCLKGGIWHKISLEDHMQILEVIEKQLGAKRHDYIFDWGSGCGHKMRYLSDKKGINGFGLDVSEKSVAYSIENTTSANSFCRANGVRIDEWMPENYFDHSLSFGSVYHVYNRTTFCSVLRSMFRVIKSGGKMYNGWTENAEYRRKDVAPCFRDLPAKVEIVEERKAFSHVSVFPLKSQQSVPNTYSVVITKLKPTVPHYWTYVPVNCTVHFCDEVPYPELPKMVS
eukprot:TRINITY_DN6882_c0_g1_i1.p1 TRINITY_DN6882_c0_g1~~TRINITY_DN6882_c0_g1_i1.p1  ORF type:complete len:434 (+),score=50.89 TRINITY_DN6882_c0_g1_i1:44-1345(+)